MSRETVRTIARDVVRFCIVGGVGLIVDVAVFNILRVTVLAPGLVHGGPVLAKLASTSIAIAMNWVGNRHWTFRTKRRDDLVREGLEFFIASLAGLVVSVACLWVSHYLLGFRSLLDDNISSNLVGLALGTAVRFVLYRSWVYGRTASQPFASQPLIDSATPQKVDPGL
ncbi:hypothetical protein GCM10022239_20630 [Leifsonia bigeumensis]|uniref:GtrA/DPMS transmembrane domain-containing protein n=1 Tax=Leifsonella bigeumensis TaxID=433643 RepID=A0ABP7FQW7_9MICO